MSGTLTNPTAGFSVGVNPATGLSGETLNAQQLQQWQNYFANPGAATSGTGTQAAAPTNQLVQTGTQWSPQIPWLTPSTGGQGMNLPLGALGIQTGGTQQQTATNIANSPYAGADPSNPYYSLILNQMAAGNFQPVYSQVPQQAAAAPQASNYAQMMGGQLFGNPTPEELQLASYFGLQPSQTQYLPGVINAAMTDPMNTFTQQMAAQNYLQGVGGVPSLAQQGYIAPGSSAAGDRG